MPQATLDELLGKPGADDTLAVSSLQRAPTKMQTMKLKAEDLSRRGIGFFTTPENEVREITDETRAPLTNFDRKNRIGWDSKGSPQKVSFAPDTGEPVLSDPYQGAPTKITKTGEIYAAPPGLPWQQTGEDPAIKADVKRKQTERLDREAISALAPIRAEAAGRYTQAARAAKASAKGALAEFGALGVPVADETGVPLIDFDNTDGAALGAHIDKSFNAEYGSDVANKTPLFGGGRLSSDAEALRKDIDRRKQRAKDIAAAHVGTLAMRNEARGQFNAIDEQRKALSRRKLDSVNAERTAAGLEPVGIPGLELNPQQFSSASGIPGVEDIQSRGELDSSGAHNAAQVGSIPTSATTLAGAASGQSNTSAGGSALPSVIEAAPANPPDDRGQWDYWTGRLGSGVDKYQSMNWLALALGANLVGAKETAKGFLEKGRANEDEAAKFQSRGPDKIENIDNPKDFAYWLGNTVTDLLPQIAETVSTAAIGAIAGSEVPGFGNAAGAIAGVFGKGAVKSLVRKEAAKLAAKGMAKEAALATAEGAVRSGLATGALKGALQGEVKALGVKAGAFLGSFASSYKSSAGEIYGDVMSDPDIDPDRAEMATLLFTAPTAALDSIVPGGVVGKLFGEAAPVVRKSAIEFAKRLGAELGWATGTEAITEGGQTLLGFAAKRWAKEQWEPLTDEEKSEFWNSAAAGAAGGGIFGGIGAISEARNRPGAEGGGTSDTDPATPEPPQTSPPPSTEPPPPAPGLEEEVPSSTDTLIPGLEQAEPIAPAPEIAATPTPSPGAGDFGTPFGAAFDAANAEAETPIGIPGLSQSAGAATDTNKTASQTQPPAPAAPSNEQTKTESLPGVPPPAESVQLPDSEETVQRLVRDAENLLHGNVTPQQRTARIATINDKIRSAVAAGASEESIFNAIHADDPIAALKQISEPPQQAPEINEQTEQKAGGEAESAIPGLDAAPKIINADGTTEEAKPLTSGPHIISTVLDEGDGKYIAGEKYNSPHQKGAGNIFLHHVSDERTQGASGSGKSAFLVQDESGKVRVTQDRGEAARIAEAAGQRKSGAGQLQSEDLNPNWKPSQTPSPERARVEPPASGAEAAPISQPTAPKQSEPVPQTSAESAPSQPHKFKQGQTVFVQKVKNGRKLHEAKVLQTYEGGGAQVRYKKTGETEDIPVARIYEPKSAESRKLYEASFEGMDDKARAKAKKDAATFKKIIASNPEIGAYDQRHNAAETASQRAAASNALKLAIERALIELGVPADEAGAQNPRTLAEKLPELQKRLKISDEQRADFEKVVRSGDEQVYSVDMEPGNELEIDGEKVKVKSVDRNGTVTLEDGKRFGVQKLHSGDSVWISLSDGDSADFLSAEDIGVDPVKDDAKINSTEAARDYIDKTNAATEKFSQGGTEQPAPQGKADASGESNVEQAQQGGTVPKLKPGQKEAELLQGANEPFNLVSETATDKAKRLKREQADDAAKEQRAKAEAKAAQDKAQVGLFEQPAHSGIKTQADTSHAGKTPRQLLAAAEPHTKYGPNYNRSISVSADGLRRAMESNPKFVQLAADELAVRLDVHAPKEGKPASSPVPKAEKPNQVIVNPATLRKPHQVADKPSDIERLKFTPDTTHVQATRSGRDRPDAPVALKDIDTLKDGGPYKKIVGLNRKGVETGVPEVVAVKRTVRESRVEAPVSPESDIQSEEHFDDEQNYFHEKVLRRLEDHDEPAVRSFTQHVEETTRWPKAGVMLGGTGARDGMFAIITPISKPGRRFQVTFFDNAKDGMPRPFGDVPVESLQDGIREAFRRKFTDTRKYPGWESTAGTRGEPARVAEGRPGELSEGTRASGGVTSRESRTEETRNSEQIPWTKQELKDGHRTRGRYSPKAGEPSGPLPDSGVRYKARADERLRGRAGEMFSAMRRADSLKPGQLVHYEGKWRTVRALRDVDGMKRGAELWVDFEDGNSIRFGGNVELPTTINGNSRNLSRETNTIRPSTEAETDAGDLQGDEARRVAESKVGEASSKPIGEDAIHAQLRSQFGIDANRDAVRVLNEPDGEWDARAIMVDGKLARIEINAAKVRSAEQLERAVFEELSHGFTEDPANATATREFLEALTPAEHEELAAEIERLGYADQEIPYERAAKAQRDLAAAWGKRNVFRRLLGRILAWARKAGLPLTRLAAERMAADAAMREAAGLRTKETVSMSGELARASKSSNGVLTKYDDLPKETQSDIEHWIAERAGLKLGENPASGSVWHEDDIRSNLRDLGNPIVLRVTHQAPEKITGFTRSTSATAVDAFSKMKTEPPPILVDGAKFIDGGHRLAAALKNKAQTIPTVDIGPLLRMDWKAWLNGDENVPSAPTSETVRESRAPAGPLPPGGIVPGPASPTPPSTHPGKIDSVFQRIYKGFRWFWEGTSDTLDRAGYTKLATAIRHQFEAESREFGETWKPIREVLEKHPDSAIGRESPENTKAKEEFGEYFNHRENDRAPYAEERYDTYSAIGKELIAAWKKVAKETGARLTAMGVEVQNPDGSWRPIGNLGEKFFPRKINQATLKVLNEPEKYPAEWTALVNDLIANGNISTAAEADAFLRQHVWHEDAKSDHFANIEKARTAKLPESWLEYKFDEIAPWYTAHYARRMGQIEAYGQEHKGGDLFDKTLKTIPKRRGYSTTQEFIEAAKDAAYMRRDNTGLAQGLRNIQTFATGAFLTNPMSAVRNVVGGITQTAVLHGPINTMRAAWKVMHRFRDGIDRAHDLGVLRDDLMQMMVETRLIDERPFSRGLRKAANLGLKVSGFNMAERFARAVALTAAQDFAVDFASNPAGAKADQQRAFLIRHHIDPAKVIAENGRGEESNRFIRASVREGQGGYKFDQTPLYMARPEVGFITQFGKWGTQATRMWTKHALNPLFHGTDIGGKTVRTALPLLYSMAFAIGGGELLYLIRGLFTDREPPDASLGEISNALTQNEMEGVRQLFNRAASDVISAGTLGMLSDYAGNLREFATRGRFRNPFDPPGVQAFKNVFNILATIKQQRTLTGKDIKDALTAQFPGAKFVEQTVKRATGEPVQAARNVQTSARQAGMRMAKELGLPVQAPFTSSVPVKSPKTPYFDAINEALLSGDVNAAKRARGEYIASLKTPEARAKAVASLSASVSGKQPISVGGISGQGQRAQFLAWAKRRLPATQFREIEALDKRYWETARAARLVSAPKPAAVVARSAAIPAKSASPTEQEFRYPFPPPRLAA
jgi:hypothetical protein